MIGNSLRLQCLSIHPWWPSLLHSLLHWRGLNKKHCPSPCPAHWDTQHCVREMIYTSAERECEAVWSSSMWIQQGEFDLHNYRSQFFIPTHSLHSLYYYQYSLKWTFSFRLDIKIIRKLFLFIGVKYFIRPPQHQIFLLACSQPAAVKNWFKLGSMKGPQYLQKALVASHKKPLKARVWTEWGCVEQCSSFVWNSLTA